MITGERVRAAMVAAGINEVEHHRCSLCGYQTSYLRDGDDLYFDAGCYCSTAGPRPAEPRTWADAAGWINMQRDPEARRRLMRRFGLETEGEQP